MGLFDALLIAFTLSLDVAVVSVGAGVLGRIRMKRALYMAFVFGAFHAVMPLLGYALGVSFKEYFIEYGRIVAATLLMIVGVKMFIESFGKEDTESEKEIRHDASLFALAFATSIDAFVIGITFTVIQVNVLLTIGIIGIVTFGMSLLGVLVGKRGKHLVGTKIEMLGAVVLMLLAVKTLLF